MNYKLIIITLFLSSICSAQKESIDLPKGIEEIEFPDDRITALFDVYLGRNGVAHVKDSLVSYKELGDLAFKFRLEHFEIWKFLVLAPLHIDKNTPYQYVDKVKRELRQSGVRYYFRTEQENSIMKGVLYPFHRPSFFYRSQMVSNTGEIQLKSYKYASYLKPDLIHSYLDNLYAKRFNRADSVLSKMKYKKIKFLKNDSIAIDGKEIAHVNVEKIYNEIKGNDICFIEYQPDLLYKYYLKNLICIKKILRKNRNKQRESVFMMPITGELQYILKKENIKL